MNDCAFIDETCDTCTSGEDGCGEFSNLVTLCTLSQTLPILDKIVFFFYLDSSTICELTTESNLFKECPSEFVTSNPETTTVGPRGCNVDFLTVDDVCVISTPGFPDFYEDYACKEWSLRPESDGASITISFDQFDVRF